MLLVGELNNLPPVHSDACHATSSTAWWHQVFEVHIHRPTKSIHRGCMPCYLHAIHSPERGTPPKQGGGADHYKSEWPSVLELERRKKGSGGDLADEREGTGDAEGEDLGCGRAWRRDLGHVDKSPRIHVPSLFSVLKRETRQSQRTERQRHHEGIRHGRR